jgi:3-hydroxyacyl-CoA dehydrogenase / enoyl-CoA hydratase / 3-hydroxybutyryl-CoA epimerase
MYSRQAKRTGFADEVVNKHKLKQAGIEAVQKYANRKIERKDRRGFFEKLLENNGLGRLIIFSQAHKKTAAETRGNYPAPPQIIESVRYGFKEGLRSGLKNESRVFGKMAVTPESRSLVQLFFAMNEAKKNPDKKIANEVKQIGVLGAGLMGTGITEVSINQGYHVWLKDQEIEQALNGKNSIHDNLLKEADKKIITKFEKETRLSYIHPTENYDSFDNIDLVIEAVFEDLNLKQKIVEEVESNTSEKCIFASNTSSLPISDIAANAKHPENIIGMHYFSPVQKMPLLEIIKTGQTADWVTSTAYEVGIKQGKTVIVVNDGPGFYTTRILAPFMNEALLLLEEGAAIEQVDKALKDFGFPVGPVALFDEVGIDVGAHVADVLSDTFETRGAKTSKKAVELVNAGYKGRKNKKGFYRYEGKKKKDVNADIYSFFGGPDRIQMDTEDMQFRLVMMMINEAVLCLEEGILMNPQDGDLGAILGLGFPPFLGGPFRYIDREGADEVVGLMEELEKDHGTRFKPADLLVEYAENGERFH